MSAEDYERGMTCRDCGQYADGCFCTTKDPDRLEVTVHVDNGGSFYLSANPHDLAHAVRRMLRALDGMDELDTAPGAFNRDPRAANARLVAWGKAFGKYRGQVEKLIR